MTINSAWLGVFVPIYFSSKQSIFLDIET